jgi:hypothetical protein
MFFICVSSCNNIPYAYANSYRPNIPVDLVASQLGFISIDAWQDFSKELPIFYTDKSKAQIDCKTSSAHLTTW